MHFLLAFHLYDVLSVHNMFLEGEKGGGSYCNPTKEETHD